ncbi:cupin domain-containing protein [candidate division KSB1 bacterium]|nr:cupin domain-containing protein [candidate division KSB1 bacterium]
MKSTLLLAFIFTALLPLKKDTKVESTIYRWDDFEVVKKETGESRPILEGNTTALKYLEMHATTLKPNRAPHGAHRHSDEEELIILKSGRLEVSINDSKHIVDAGSVIVLMPGEEHGLRNIGDGEATYYVYRYKSRADVDEKRAKENGGSKTFQWNDLVFNEHDKGGRRDVLDQGTAMFKRFEMHVTTLNPGLITHAAHSHPAEEFVLVKEGNVEFHIGDKIHKATTGDFMFVDSTVPHTLNNIGDKPATYYAFQWE